MDWSVRRPRRCRHWTAPTSWDRRPRRLIPPRDTRAPTRHLPSYVDPSPCATRSCASSTGGDLSVISDLHAVGSAHGSASVCATVGRPPPGHSVGTGTAALCPCRPCLLLLFPLIRGLSGSLALLKVLWILQEVCVAIKE